MEKCDTEGSRCINRFAMCIGFTRITLIGITVTLCLTGLEFTTVFERDTRVSSNCKHFGLNAIRLEFLREKRKEGGERGRRASEDNYLYKKKEKKGKREKGGKRFEK